MRGYFSCVKDTTASAARILYARDLDFLVVRGFALHEGKVASVLMVSQKQETDDDREPVQVVRYDGTIGGRVLPSEDCIEYTPSSATIDLWIAEL